MIPFVRRLPASLRSVAPVAVVVLALASALPALAQEDNPFARPVPAGGGAPTPPSPLDTLELRGVLPLNGKVFITLYDTASTKGLVVELGGTASNITVSDYQPADDTVLVQSGGKERRVGKRKAQITAMAVPPPVPVPQPGVPVVAGGPPPPPPGQTGAMGDEEVRVRMARVAEEIRRRREMRREIMERSQQGQPAQPQQ